MKHALLPLALLLLATPMVGAVNPGPADVAIIEVVFERTNQAYFDTLWEGCVGIDYWEVRETLEHWVIKAWTGTQWIVLFDHPEIRFVDVKETEFGCDEIANDLTASRSSEEQIPPPFHIESSPPGRGWYNDVCVGKDLYIVGARYQSHTLQYWNDDQYEDVAEFESATPFLDIRHDDGFCKDSTSSAASGESAAA